MENKMSTRATYKFLVEASSSQLACFYIHHDGYPEGAAQYLMNIFKKNGEETRNAVYADKFYRNNPGARLTQNHQYHTDTEYCYDIGYSDYPWVKAKKASYGYGAFDECNRKWKTFFDGKVEDFIVKYLEKDDPRLPLIDEQYCADFLSSSIDLLLACKDDLNKEWWGNANYNLIDFEKNLSKLLSVEKFGINPSVMDALAMYKIYFPRLYVQDQQATSLRLILGVLNQAIAHLEERHSSYK
jgi:hypothetical protein